MASSSSNKRHPLLVGNDRRRFWNLTYTLAATDFKLKFFGSALGYVWSLMRPLMLFGTLYLVFTKVFRLGSEIKFYPAYLLTSLMLWTFFAETTGAGVNCLLTRESLLRKMRFPRLVIPFSTVLTSLFSLGTNMVAIMIFVFASGVKPRLSWLWFPPILLLLTVLTTGIVMLLGALYVKYRDIDPIWDVIRQALFYTSPVLFAVSTYPISVQSWALLNPIALITTAMRHTLLDPTAPTPGEVMGSNFYVLIPVAITLAIFAIGLAVFTRANPRIAENL